MAIATVVSEYVGKEQILRELAQDIVRDIHDVPDILKKFGITQAEYLQLAETAGFKQMLQLASMEWDAAANTPDRIKLKSALIVEKSLPDLFGTLNDSKEPLSGRVELFKTLAKIGGLGNPPPVNAGAPGQVFRLQINFPDPTKNIVIEHNTLPSEVAPIDGEFVDNEFA